MTKTIINSVKQLPAWFELKKYERARELTTEDWLLELHHRYYLQCAAECHWQEIRETHWEPIASYGLVSKLETSVSSFKTLPSLIPSNPLHHAITIQPITKFTAYNFLFCDPNRSEIEAKLAHFWQGTPSPFKNNEDWELEPYQGADTSWESDVFLSINLKASDEQLKRDFALWLAEQRERQSIKMPKKNFTQLDYEDWCDLQVLPYLDLTFWAARDDIKIHQHVLAHALFPDAYALGCDIDPVGRLRTTKKKADYLMTQEIMMALDHQVTADNEQY